jgi:NAD(P)H-dependent FMN reductase
VSARLLIVIASVRPRRIGLPIATWFLRQAERHAGFDLELADLAELALPFMDEPNHPRLRRYTRHHTRNWSRRVEAADAFVFVTPEYNHGMSAPLKNAIDYLHAEWQYKPVGFVAYGGVSGGTRGVQMAKQVVTAVKLFPTVEAVYIPFAAKLVEQGDLRATDALDRSAHTMLDELVRLESALRALRRRGD